MRLTPIEHEAIKRAAQSSFEPGVVLRLFGSRVDDAKRGGDIDLLVETRLQDAAEIARAHTPPHTRLAKQRARYCLSRLITGE